jgi:hypothetical protein
MTVKRRAEVTVADLQAVVQFVMEASKGGNDPGRLLITATRELVKSGAPPAVLRVLSQMMAIVTFRREIEKRKDEKKLALLRAQLALVADDTPSEQIFPLADLYNDLRRGSGKKPRRIGLRNALTVFSAAVTILKKGRTVDAAIAEIATPNGLNRKQIKNFRDRLNRGLAKPSDEFGYRHALAYMEGMTRAELISHVAQVAKQYCT